MRVHLMTDEPFDLDKEIGGSIKEIDELAPKGKKVDVIAWSGDCLPWEEVLQMTRTAHMQNLNGGDSRFDHTIETVNGFVTVQ